jgi:hypothetical protein
MLTHSTYSADASSRLTYLVVLLFSLLAGFAADPIMRAAENDGLTFNLPMWRGAPYLHLTLPSPHLLTKPTSMPSRHRSFRPPHRFLPPLFRPPSPRPPNPPPLHNNHLLPPLAHQPESRRLPPPQLRRRRHRPPRSGLTRGSADRRLSLVVSEGAGAEACSNPARGPSERRVCGGFGEEKAGVEPVWQNLGISDGRGGSSPLCQSYVAPLGGRCTLLSRSGAAVSIRFVCLSFYQFLSSSLESR